MEETSDSSLQVPTFRMSLIDKENDATDAFENQDNRLHPHEEPTEASRFLNPQMSASKQSIFSKYSEMSIAQLRKDYQLVFVLISFLMFFISGLFSGAVLVKMFLCKEGNLTMANLNGSITLSEQFDMML